MTSRDGPSQRPCSAAGSGLPPNPPLKSGLGLKLSGQQACLSLAALQADRTLEPRLQPTILAARGNTPRPRAVIGEVKKHPRPGPGRGEKLCPRAVS